MSELRVGIVGGGIAGLTLAALLRRRGIEAEGVEIAPAWAPVGAGIALGFNAVAVLDRLGLTAELETLGAPILSGRITDQRFRVLSEADLSPLARRFGLSVAIHRAHLHRILVGAAGPAAFRLGVTFDSLHDDGSGVDVAYSDGRTSRFDVLVGADGIGSRVRAQGVGPRERMYSGYTCWRFCVPWDPATLAGPSEMWGRGHRFGIVPIGPAANPEVYCFATANAPRGREDPPEGRAKRLADRFADFGGPVAEIVSRVSDAGVRHDDLDELADGPWQSGRIVLLGDAAHAMTPNMGQGAGMAIEDAWVLAERLSALPANADPHAIEDALSSYTRERRARVIPVQKRSRTLGRVAQWSAAPLCALRNLAVRLTPAATAERALAALIEGAPVGRD